MCNEKPPGFVDGLKQDRQHNLGVLALEPSAIYLFNNFDVPRQNCAQINDLALDSELFARHVRRLLEHINLRSPADQRHVVA